MPIPDGLQYATQFQLDDLTIITASGVLVDLREVMHELNIFEDLFSNTMTGSLLISDTQDLINVLPILGTEYLLIKLSKPSSPWKLEKTFRIYKITDRSKNTPSLENYILHFCSEELVLSESLRISNSYKSIPISDIVQDVTKNYLKIDSVKFPPSELTRTVGNFDIVVPFWTPFYTINWLSRMARTGQTPGCSFVFFEDSIGYHFTAIELLTQQKPLQVVNFMPLNLAGETREKSDKPDTQQRLEAAEDYEMTNAPDMMRLISSGMYASKLMVVNTIDQQIKITTLDGTDFFKKTKHTNKNTFIQTETDRTHLKQTEHHDAYYRVSVDNLKVDTWLLQRNAYFAALHGFQTKVVVPGNVFLRVGQVITLNLPAASIGRKEEKPMDILFSGNYLITAIRHKIDRAKYVCILELSKDSITEQLPGPLEGNSTLNKIRRA